MFGRLLAGPKNELEAVQIAGGDRTLRRIWQGVRAGIALALNPDDTQQVFYLAYSVDIETLPLVAERLRAAPSGGELLERKPAIDSLSVDFAALRALPENTLGGAATLPDGARASSRRGRAVLAGHCLGRPLGGAAGQCPSALEPHPSRARAFATRACPPGCASNAAHGGRRELSELGDRVSRRQLALPR